MVLAAGAIGSPALLMQSGIGPAAHLAEVGVAMQYDLPGVGENLHDHLQIALRYRQPDHRDCREVRSDVAGGLIGSVAARKGCGQSLQAWAAKSRKAFTFCGR